MFQIVFALIFGVLCTSPIYGGDVKTYYSTSHSAFHTKFHQNGENRHCTILSTGEVRKFRGFEDETENALHIRVKAAEQPVDDTMFQLKDSSQIIELYGRRQETIKSHMELLCKTMKKLEPLPATKADPPEIRKIADGGDQLNRIDVVFMGDGYALDERDKFFDDMNRLTEEMFEGVTFRSYLPLFNIWAIYVESNESGIGYTGQKDTAFGLYRQSGQLRGIFPGNPSYARQICQLTGPSGCEYPSLIGNDDYYGGLGGEFVISTKSNRTGTMVLRHEMGHNFVNVGEEYDNGQVYRGVNSASSVATLGWSHWLSGTAREERAMYRILEYPWFDLSRDSWNFTFVSDNSFSSWYLAVSVSAAGEFDSLEFSLDGIILPWNTTGFDDREFYGWTGQEGFSNGIHRFSVRSKTASTNPDIPRMICSVRLHEFGAENEFVQSNDYVSAYPTWDVSRRKTFRPTNAGCLMRNMTHNELCNICREGMWYQFLERISLIDQVAVDPAEPGNPHVVSLSTLRVAHFRQPGNEVEGEELNTKWYHNGEELEQMRNEFRILAQPGDWRVEVNFVTPEVRNDPRNLLNEFLDFTV